MAQRIPILNEIADNKEEDAGARLKAIDLMGKYGIGTVKEVSLDHVTERLSQTLGEIRRQLPADQAETLIAGIEPFWR